MSEKSYNICDSKVFDTIFNTHAKNLKRFLYFKYNDMETAKDVMQESFIKLWNNCGKVEYIKAKAYLYKIANNAFLDIKRHQNVVYKHQKSFVNYNTPENPEFLMIEEEFLSKIERTIAELPEKDRQVFLLSRMEKKKYREIAQLLDISIKTVEKRMHNALIVIRKEIGNI